MRKDAGFTIMEIMVALGILAILAAIAVPNFIGWRNKAQLSRAARDVYSILQKAKIEAVRQNVNCRITFGDNDFVLYVDSDEDFSYSAGDRMISSKNWSEYPGVSLDTSQGGGDGLSFANPGDGIAFAPNGFPKDSTGSLAGGTVYLNNLADKKSSVSVSAAGSVWIN